MKYNPQAQVLQQLREPILRLWRCLSSAKRWLLLLLLIIFLAVGSGFVMLDSSSHASKMTPQTSHKSRSKPTIHSPANVSESTHVPAAEDGGTDKANPGSGSHTANSAKSNSKSTASVGSGTSDGNSGAGNNDSGGSSCNLGLLCNYPNQLNTGYENAPGYPGNLTNCSSITLQPNTTYKYCLFPNGLAVGQYANTAANDTFIGCVFESNNVADANVADYSDNVTFEYDTFQPSTVAVGNEPTSPYATPLARSEGYQYGIDQRYSGSMTIDHSDFWGFADAIQWGYSSEASPVTFSNNWIHNPHDDGGVDHTDGILESYGGDSYVTFNHNTIVGNGNTQAIALQGSTPYDHVSITNNYLSGYGYMVDAGPATDTNETFTGNVWSSEFEPNYGPLYARVFSSSGVWHNNTLHVVPGTTWLASGNNGLYWWPSDGLPTSPMQIIGHTTDY